MTNIPHDPNELLAVVDDKDNVIGTALRKEVHGTVDKFHRHSSVLIVNKMGQILLQKRKDNGRLDYSASGHFPHDMGYLDAAVKETEEELGLKIDKTKFVEVLKVRDPTIGHGGVFVCLFEVKGNYSLNEMKIDHLEVESVRYYSVDEIKNILSSTSGARGFFRILKLYLEKRGFS